MSYNGKDVRLYHDANPVSDTNPLPVALSGSTPSSGRVKVALLQNDHAGTPVTTAAYVQLTAATGAEINKLQIFHSSDAALYLAFGAGGSEVNQIYIFPGGNGDVDLNIPAGTRVSVKAVSTNATAGELLINCLS